MNIKTSISLSIIIIIANLYILSGTIISFNPRDKPMREISLFFLFYRGRNQGTEINLNCSHNQQETEFGFKPMQSDSSIHALNNYTNWVYISAILVLHKIDKLP